MDISKGGDHAGDGRRGSCLLQNCFYSPPASTGPTQEQLWNSHTGDCTPTSGGPLKPGTLEPWPRKLLSPRIRIAEIRGRRIPAGAPPVVGSGTGGRVRRRGCYECWQGDGQRRGSTDQTTPRPALGGRGRRRALPSPRPQGGGALHAACAGSPSVPGGRTGPRTPGKAG